MQGQRVMWKDMTKPVSLEEHAGAPIKPTQRPDPPTDVSERITVKAQRPAYVEPGDIADQRRNKITERAKQLAGSRDYQFGDPNPNVGGLLRGGFLKGGLAPKCNIFVGDVFAGAGIDIRDPKNRSTYLTTRVWGDRNADIPGFQVLGPKDSLKPGDVIAAGGHLGIYVPGPKGERWTISAASPEHGDAVVHNAWGFRGNEENPVRWRYIGPSGSATPPQWLTSSDQTPLSTIRILVYPRDQTAEYRWSNMVFLERELPRLFAVLVSFIAGWVGLFAIHEIAIVMASMSGSYSWSDALGQLLIGLLPGFPLGLVASGLIVLMDVCLGDRLSANRLLPVGVLTGACWALAILAPALLKMAGTGRSDMELKIVEIVLAGLPFVVLGLLNFLAPTRSA